MSLVQTVLSNDTLVPIGVAAAVMLPLSLGFIWLRDRLLKIDSKLSRLEELQLGAWRLVHMQSWTIKLARDNPALKVPDIEEPR